MAGGGGGGPNYRTKQLTATFNVILNLNQLKK